MRYLLLGVFLIGMSTMNIANASFISSPQFVSGNEFTVNSEASRQALEEQKRMLDISREINKIGIKTIKEVQKLITTANTDYKFAMLEEDVTVRNKELFGVLATLKLAMEKDATNPKPYLFASQVYAAMGDFENGKINFDKAIELYPNSPYNKLDNRGYFDMAVAYYASDVRYLDGVVFDEAMISEYCNPLIGYNNSMASYMEGQANSSVLAKMLSSKKGIKVMKNSANFYSFLKSLMLHDKEDADKYYLDVMKDIDNIAPEIGLKGILSQYPEVVKGNFWWIKNDADKAEKEFILSCIRTGAY